MFGWIKNRLFTCLIRGFSFYYIKQIDFVVVCSVIDTQYDIIMWEEQKSDPLVSAARELLVSHFFILPTL